jgi:hypothetical protein
VHHLNLRIPNYRLEECHKADTRLQSAPLLTLSTALRALGYALWDDDTGRMVRFSEVASQRRRVPLSVAEEMRLAGADPKMAELHFRLGPAKRGGAVERHDA